MSLTNQPTNQPNNAISFEEAHRHYLSETEMKVLKHVGLGFSRKEIAARLGCKPSTIQTHRRNIKKKLNLKGRGNLKKWCRVNAEALYGMDLNGIPD